MKTFTRYLAEQESAKIILALVNNNSRDIQIPLGVFASAEDADNWKKSSKVLEGLKTHQDADDWFIATKLYRDDDISFRWGQLEGNKNGLWTIDQNKSAQELLNFYLN